MISRGYVRRFARTRRCKKGNAMTVAADKNTADNAVSRKLDGSPIFGAAFGASVGGAVAGPIGAAVGLLVGAAIGASTGSSSEPPKSTQK